MCAEINAVFDRREGLKDARTRNDDARERIIIFYEIT